MTERSGSPAARQRHRCNRLLGVIVPLAPEYNMGGFLRRNELNAFVSQSAHVNPLEQSLSPAQQDRRDSDVQLIDLERDRVGCPPTSLSSSCRARNRESVRTCFFRESRRQNS
jgi:hypothetical protein